MTKKMIAALALVALGLIGVTLAMTSAVLDMRLPSEQLAHINENSLTILFLSCFFGGVLLIGMSACWWDALVEEQKANKNREHLRDMRQEIRDHRKVASR